jgi:hypothetical protein
MFDPRVGVWLSEDPTGGLVAADWNEARYVGNEPTDFSDPTGLQAQEPEKDFYKHVFSWGTWGKVSAGTDPARYKEITIDPNYLKGKLLVSTKPKIEVREGANEEEAMKLSRSSPKRASYWLTRERTRGV